MRTWIQLGTHKKQDPGPCPYWSMKGEKVSFAQPGGHRNLGLNPKKSTEKSRGNIKQTNRKLKTGTFEKERSLKSTFVVQYLFL